MALTWVMDSYHSILNLVVHLDIISQHSQMHSNCPMQLGTTLTIDGNIHNRIGGIMITIEIGTGTITTEFFDGT